MGSGDGGSAAEKPGEKGPLRVDFFTSPHVTSIILISALPSVFAVKIAGRRLEHGAGRDGNRAERAAGICCPRRRLRQSDSV